MRPAAVTLLVATLSIGACGGPDTEADRLTIVATTSVWGDVVSRIVGHEAEVEVIIPRGADAHDYQPSPQQVATLMQADLVVANGLGLEEGLIDVLRGAKTDGVDILQLGPHLDPLPFSEREREHQVGGQDPHVWFDLDRVALATKIIAVELAELDGSVEWGDGASAYRTDLASADSRISEILAAVPEEKRKLVTNHDAFGYFADRYGFEIVGVVIPGGSTLADPSSAALAHLVQVIQDEEVPAIFTESTQPSTLAEAVAAEVGRDISVVSLYTGSLGEPPADSLIGMITEDARRIADALD